MMTVRIARGHSHHPLSFAGVTSFSHRKLGTSHNTFLPQ